MLFFFLFVQKKRCENNSTFWLINYLIKCFPFSDQHFLSSVGLQYNFHLGVHSVPHVSSQIDYFSWGKQNIESFYLIAWSLSKTDNGVKRFFPGSPFVHFWWIHIRSYMNLSRYARSSIVSLIFWWLNNDLNDFLEIKQESLEKSESRKTVLFSFSMETKKKFKNFYRVIYST